MNKHQIRAFVAASVALCLSFVVWSKTLDRIPLPHVAEGTVSQFHTILEKLFSDIQETQEVTVQHVTVEDLGDHFATSIQTTNVSASVSHSSEIAQVPDSPMPAAPTELQQWELSRVWSITIPSLGIRAPVFVPSMTYWSTQAWDLLEEQMQVGLNHGAVAYPHSASPGANGSLIIAGHSSPPDERAEESKYGDLFAKLPDIEIGEEISVVTSGAPVRYRVEEKFIVSPTMTSILEQQHDESILKLITCYPVGTTRDRMIVLAKKI